MPYYNTNRETGGELQASREQATNQKRLVLAVFETYPNEPLTPDDVHNFIKDFAEAGSDIITIHPEATDNLQSSIKKIKSFNKKIGISLNPETSIDKVLPVLNSIDLVLVMSVHPGFGGQKFIEKTLEKVKQLRKEIDKNKFQVQIEIDGGINFENSKIAKSAGVDILVSGTTIFKENEGNLKKNIQLLRTG